MSQYNPPPIESIKDMVSKLSDENLSIFYLWLKATVEGDIQTQSVIENHIGFTRSSGTA